MTAETTTRGRGIGAGIRALVLLLLSMALAVPESAEAQYFGRNKVQYDDFDFKILKTDHFDIYYYPEEGEAIEDVARMAERWYERFARAFQHEFEQPKPLIMYADHPDFQQTNTLRGTLGEGTGGVTESLKNRVIMPMTGSYWDTDHVLGHELIHAFQYNIAQSRQGGGLQGLSTLPLWLIEGMAEYLSVGRDDPLTAMWLRDAVRRDDFPTIRQMTREARFFPYRFGQALWAYIGGEYGDDAVFQIYRRALRIGFQPALGQVLGLSTDSLSAQWRRRVEQAYIPLMEGRSAPEEVGETLITSETGGGNVNVSPSLSPNGRYIAFLSEKDLFTVDLFLADARTGEVIRKLYSANSDPHSDALSYVEAAGTWSPDGESFAYTVFAEGDNEIVIVDVEDGDVTRRIKPEGIGALNGPAWSPDGRSIAFTGLVGGISDLYTVDLETGEIRQLTNDKNADFHPTWSPDGTTIAFASDRGPETDFDVLNYSRFQITLLDVRTQETRVLPLFGNVRHANPQYAPDGESLFFISDRDGFADVYEVELDDLSTRRHTRVATGVSGITRHSPALTVARETGEVAFSVFDEFEYRIHRLPDEHQGETLLAQREDASEFRGRKLPPVSPDRFSRVAEYLEDPSTGLPDAGTFRVSDADEYDSSLGLDYIGQPSIGVGTDRFGNYVGGGASAFFSDMLGNRLLGVAIQAQGTFKDIGGQVVYQDLSDRWNWGAAVGRIPYLFIRSGFQPNPNTGRTDFIQRRQRIFVTSASGQVSYPLSSTRRFEFGGGVVRYAYDIEQDRFILDDFGRPIDVIREDLDEQEPDPLNLAQASVGYVGDNSFFGFTSPIRGGRFRFEVQGTTGSEDFVTAIADWRRYWQPHRNLTVAFRGMHYGRYGGIDDQQIIQPYFLGYETLIRGYDNGSFETSECTEAPGVSGCPPFDRLFGNRIAVSNFEFRVPLIGVEQYGLVDFGFLPTELVVFQDAAVAWYADEEPVLTFERNTARRVPVFSTGVGARFNLLGFLVLEAYYAYPWQRPDKGAHWGFNVAPGW